MPDQDPSHPRFQLPQTPGQVRTLIHQYPVDWSAKVMARHQNRLIFSRAILFPPTLLLVGSLAGFARFALVLAVVIGVAVALLALLYHFTIPRYFKTALTPYQNIQRLFAFDSHYYWHQTTDGIFAQTPLQYIHCAWFEDDALVLAINKFMYYVIPLTTLPNPQDVEILKNHFSEAGKLCRVTFFRTLKHMDSRKPSMRLPSDGN